MAGMAAAKATLIPPAIEDPHRAAPPSGQSIGGARLSIALPARLLPL